MIKAIIFDCFGVIVGKGFYYTYEQAGGDTHADKQFIDDMLNQTNLGLISDAEFNKVMAERLGKTDHQWQTALIKAEQADEQLLDYAKSLRKNYKTAVLSNSNRGVLKEKIGENHLSTCFDEVVCSAEVGIIKPSPGIYQLTANRLGVKTNECIFIDDHESFVKAAEDIGMHGVVYKDLSSLKKEVKTLLSR